MGLFSQEILRYEGETSLFKNLERVVFCTPSKIPLHSEFPQSSDYHFSIDILQTSEPTVELKEDFSRKPVRHISHLQNRSIRNRLAELRSHVEAVAQHEDSTAKTIAI